MQTEHKRKRADTPPQSSELEKAQAAQIYADIRLKKLSFAMRWAIVWLTLGGFIKFDSLGGLVQWIKF